MDRSASGRRPLVDILGRWRGVWWCGYPESLPPPQTSAASLPAAPAISQPPVPPPDLHLRSQGRRQALHCAHLDARVLLLVSTSDARRRAAATATNQDGSGRAIAASAASAGLGPLRALGLCELSGPWLPVPRGTQAFHPSSAMDATEGPRASTHCWILATRLDMQPGGYFMSRLDKMWDEGDMHAA